MSNQHDDDLELPHGMVASRTRDEITGDDPVGLLGSLPALDVDPDAAERIRLRARAELARAARPIPIRRALHRAYRRTELVLVGAIAASYLALALRAALIPFS